MGDRIPVGHQKAITVSAAQRGAMFFGAVKVGKAYVSVHLMPLYMCAPLQSQISPALSRVGGGAAAFGSSKLGTVGGEEMGVSQVLAL